MRGLRRVGIGAATLAMVLVTTGGKAPSQGNSKANPPAKQETGPTEEVRPVMFQFLATVRALYPFATNDKAFSDPKNEQEIGRLLDAMQRDSQALGHFRSLETPGYAVSQNLLREHVARTAEMFHAGHKAYARWMVNETLEGCIACHTQLPSSKAPSVRLLPERVEGSALDKADLLFATRQFDQALAAYDEIIRTAPAVRDVADPRPPEQVALRRKLAIWLRVKRDPTGAAKSLEQDLASSKVIGPMRAQIEGWIRELRTPGLVPSFDPAKAKPAQVAEYARTVLATELPSATVMENPRHAASYLLLSGVLYEYMTRNPGARESAETLFWLAKCDRALNGDFFFSQADLYLQECVRRAPKTPIARRCYEEFAETVEFQFTGSRGTEIPPEIEALLAELKRQAG